MTILELEVLMSTTGAYKLSGNWILTPAAMAILAARMKD